jgi:uncharacterized membrane protein YfcA
MEWAVTALVGLVAGVMSGMFGIGGGVVIVPMLVYILKFNQQRAQGTSLAVLVLPVAILGVMNYWKAGQVDTRAAAIIAAGFVLGGWIGSKVSLSMDETIVRRAFAVLLVVIAVQMWVGKGR